MKKIIAIVLILIFMLILCACNVQMIDTTWHFNYAQIKMPDGSIVEGEVQSWRDYEDGDQLQIKIDGVQYLTHSTNVVLVSK